MKLFFSWGEEGGWMDETKSSQVPDMFPQRVPNSTSLLSHVLWASVVLLSFTCIGKPKGGGTLYFKIELSILESLLRSFIFFFWVMGQSNWLIAKKKIWTWEAPHLINWKMNRCGVYIGRMRRGLNIHRTFCKFANC
jgi:hypothetical protein